MGKNKKPNRWIKLFENIFYPVFVDQVISAYHKGYEEGFNFCVELAKQKGIKIEKYHG